MSRSIDRGTALCYAPPSTQHSHRGGSIDGGAGDGSIESHPSRPPLHERVYRFPDLSHNPHTQKSQAPMNSVTLTPTHMGALCTYLTMLYAMCYVHVGEAKQGAESQ